MAAGRFAPPLLDAIGATKYLRVRAGSDHRFIAIWVLVVEGRVFARSWNNKPHGWFAAFLAAKEGTIEIAGKQVDVRVRRVDADHLLDAVTDGLARKFTTKANKPYVEGFAEPGRRANTLEFLPAKGK